MAPPGPPISRSTQTESILHSPGEISVNYRLLGCYSSSIPSLKDDDDDDDDNNVMIVMILHVK